MNIESRSEGACDGRAQGVEGSVRGRRARWQSDGGKKLSTRSIAATSRRCSSSWVPSIVFVSIVETCAAAIARRRRSRPPGRQTRSWPTTAAPSKERNGAAAAALDMMAPVRWTIRDQSITRRLRRPRGWTNGRLRWSPSRSPTPLRAWSGRAGTPGGRPERALGAAKEGGWAKPAAGTVRWTWVEGGGGDGGGEGAEGAAEAVRMTNRAAPSIEALPQLRQLSDLRGLEIPPWRRPKSTRGPGSRT